MTYTDYNGIKQYQRLLSECSYDSEHNEFMCKSELQVIDFDHVKRAYLNDRNFSEEKAKSVDVIASGTDNITYLVEFKNGDVNNEKKSIPIKIRDSILMVCDICKCSISKTREDVVFVLVYNEERSNLPWETKRMLGGTNLSGRPIPFLGLDKVEGFLVKKALMVTEKRFEEKILPKLAGRSSM
jgi:hypothetical protein